LVEAGAKMLGVDAASCQVSNGEVSAGGKSVSYGEIVAADSIDRTFTDEEIAALPLKPASERQLLKRDIKALDVPAKTDGSARFGIDAELPGMVYARALMPPTRYGSSVMRVDESRAKGVPGYLGHQVLNDPSETLQGWVSVVAETQWAADAAAEAISVRWKPGPTANVFEEDILARGEELVAADDSGYRFVDDGDVDQAKADAAKTIEAIYRTGTALHFQLEPVNATVEFKDGVCHVHAGNQWQSLILPVLSKALEMPEDKIVLHQYYLGGGFGRRLFGDYMIPAALTAKAVGKPVKMVFSRPDDARLDCPRSASVQRFVGCMDGDGTLTGVEHAAAAGWPTLAMAPGFLGPSTDGQKSVIDGFSINGADHWYTLPNHRVRAINNDLAQQTFLPGWLRSVGPGWIAWGVESFNDELAHALGEDPFEFRLKRLDGSGKNAGAAPSSVGGAKRLAAVLEKLREQCGWGGELPDGEGLGVACSFGQERNMPTWIACAAHVAVDRDSGQTSVKKLYLTVDCGTVVHPDGAMAQATGSALWGLSLALHEGTVFENGQVKDRNLDTYTPLRMSDVPEIDVQFINSDEMPVGMGEPGTTVVGPAIGNAIFNAVGARVRDLPIRPDAVKTAMKT
jgi:CO/xanthine dehydrogenase Mo-binding subunit